MMVLGMRHDVRRAVQGQDRRFVSFSGNWMADACYANELAWSDRRLIPVLHTLGIDPH